jgi:transcriptional regulator, ArgR family
MTISTSRSARQQRITEILSAHAVRSQTQLLDLLAADGIEVTQATLSRDLVDVGAEKVRVGKNLVYAVPSEGGDRTVRVAPDAAEVSTRLVQRCQELLVSADVSANLVILRTPRARRTSSPRPSTTAPWRGWSAPSPGMTRSW